MKFGFADRKSLDPHSIIYSLKWTHAYTLANLIQHFLTLIKNDGQCYISASRVFQLKYLFVGNEAEQNCGKSNEKGVDPVAKVVFFKYFRS